MSITTSAFNFFVGTPPVLTDPDSNAVTISVVRADNGAAVSSGSYTRVSTGIYTYTFTDPAYNLIYLITTTYTYLSNTETKTDVVYGTRTPGGFSTYGIPDMRRLVRKNARNAMSSGMYTDQDIDDAYFAAADDLTRYVLPNRTLTTLQLTAGSAAVPQFPADWTPENTLQVDLILNGQILNPGISFVSMEQLLYEQSRRGGLTVPTGRPLYMAVPDASAAAVSGVLDVAADNNYIINLWRWTPFAPWVSGQASLTGAIGTSHQVTSVTVGQFASGYYPTTPTITVAGGSGSGATFTPVMSNGAISSVTVSASGSGYTGSLIFSINGTPATGVGLGFTDEQVRKTAMSQAVYYLQRNEPENFERCELLHKEFVAWCQRMKSAGVGTRGGQVSIKDDSEPNRNPQSFYPQA